MSRDKPLTLLRHCDTSTIPIHDNNDLTAKVEIHGDIVFSMTKSMVGRIWKTGEF
jgi:hypothetical protein